MKISAIAPGPLKQAHLTSIVTPTEPVPITRHGIASEESGAEELETCETECKESPPKDDPLIRD
jgi:hypothetical protein